MRPGQSPPPQPIFPKLFPRPTGRNGWERVVQVADRLSGTAWDEFEALPSAQLDRDRTRRLMRTAPMAELRDDLLAASGMPFVSPRTSMDFRTELPDLASFRKVARFLAAVLFDAAAGGNRRDVVPIAESGMRIARAVRGEAVIGTLVAVAAETILLRRIVQIAPLLSEADADGLGLGLLALARDRTPWREGFERESRMLIGMLGASDRSGTRETLEEEANPETRAIARLFGDGAEAAVARARAMDRVRQSLAQTLGQLDDPARYGAAAPPPSKDPTDRMIDAILPATHRVVGRILQVATEERLTGLYLRAWAARRRRLEWPPTLAGLAGPEDLRQVAAAAPIEYAVLPDGDAVVLRARPIPTGPEDPGRPIQVPPARSTG
ncbi:MAG: hypothetical protein ACKO5K_03705 [Armatimonadota bacterium]